MGIEIKWERKDGTLVGMLSGRIDSSNADEARTLLEDGMGAEDNSLVLDFEQLSFISSAGLRVLLVIARTFKEPGKKFGICSLSDSVREVVTISGFDQMIEVHASRAEAIQALLKES